MNTKLDDFINVLPTMELYTDGAFINGRLSRKPINLII